MRMETRGPTPRREEETAREAMQPGHGEGVRRPLESVGTGGAASRGTSAAPSHDRDDSRVRRGAGSRPGADAQVPGLLRKLAVLFGQVLVCFRRSAPRASSRRSRSSRAVWSRVAPVVGPAAVSGPTGIRTRWRSTQPRDPAPVRRSTRPGRPSPSTQPAAPSTPGFPSRVGHRSPRDGGTPIRGLYDTPSDYRTGPDRPVREEMPVVAGRGTMGLASAASHRYRGVAHQAVEPSLRVIMRIGRIERRSGLGHGSRGNVGGPAGSRATAAMPAGENASAWWPGGVLGVAGEMGGRHPEAAYRRFVDAGLATAPAGSLPGGDRRWLLGGPEFVDRVRTG